MTVYMTTLDWIEAILAFELDLWEAENPGSDRPRPVLAGPQIDRWALPKLDVAQLRDA